MDWSWQLAAYRNVVALRVRGRRLKADAQCGETTHTQGSTAPNFLASRGTQVRPRIGPASGAI